jgi:tRNA (guanine37-N1)-methyltransferase
MRLYIGLLHYPVYNKNRQRIASAITTVDLHDLSRLARTYGVKRFFVITPLEDQQRLAERIFQHWVSGFGAIYNRNRKEAIELMGISPTLEASMEEIKELEGEAPLLMVTDASKRVERTSVTFSEAADIIGSEKTVFLIFGTAWGLDEEMIQQADYILDPIETEGKKSYNHLSVRTAAAIILDRLIAKWE